MNLNNNFFNLCYLDERKELDERLQRQLYFQDNIKIIAKFYSNEMIRKLLYFQANFLMIHSNANIELIKNELF